MMHRNSLAAYDDLAGVLGDRQLAIYRVLERAGPLTDRAVVEEMDLLEMNSARPRITELIKTGWAKEVGSVHCHVTGRRVRLVQAVSEAERWDATHQTKFWE